MEFHKYNEKPANSYSRQNSQRRIVASSSQCSTPAWKDSPLRKARSHLKERFIQHQREFEQFVHQHYQKEPVPQSRYDMSKSLEKLLDTLQLSSRTTPTNKKQIKEEKGNLRTISGSEVDLLRQRQFQFKLKLDESKKVRVPSIKPRPPPQKSSINWMIASEEPSLDFPALVSARNSSLHGHFQQFRIKNEYDMASESESFKKTTSTKKKKYKRGFTQALRRKNSGDLKSLRHKSMLFYPRKYPIGLVSRKGLELNGPNELT